MKATPFLLAILCLPVALPAQEWPPIPPDQANLKEAPKGQRLNAMLLYHSVAIDDEKRTLEEHCRIKILKDEGLEQAFNSLDAQREARVL